MAVMMAEMINLKATNMTFSSVLRAVYKTYSVDTAFLSQKMKTSIGLVKKWENGEALPSRKQYEDFSAMFAIPLSILLSCKEKE